MGGIIGEYEQVVEINGVLYKYIYYDGLEDSKKREREKHINELLSGKRTDIPEWLHAN